MLKKVWNGKCGSEVCNNTKTGAHQAVKLHQREDDEKFWEGKNGEPGATIAITLILWRPRCLPIASWNPYTKKMTRFLPAKVEFGPDVH